MTNEYEELENFEEREMESLLEMERRQRKDRRENAKESEVGYQLCILSNAALSDVSPQNTHISTDKEGENRTKKADIDDRMENGKSDNLKISFTVKSPILTVLSAVKGRSISSPTDPQASVASFLSRDLTFVSVVSLF